MNNIKEILSKHIDSIKKESLSLDEYLGKHPEAGKVKDLLKIAIDVGGSGKLLPSPESSHDNRRKFLDLVDEAAAGHVPVLSENTGFNYLKKFRTWFGVNHLRQAAVVATVFLTLSGGVAVAASGALPTSPLYNIKQLEERANVALPRPAFAKATVHLNLAENRVSEINNLLDSKGSNSIPALFVNLNKNLQAAFGLESRMSGPQKSKIETRIKYITKTEAELLNKYNSQRKSGSKKTDPTLPKSELKNKRDNEKPRLDEDKPAAPESEQPDNENQDKIKTKESHPQSGAETVEPPESGNGEIKNSGNAETQELKEKVESPEPKESDN